MDDFHAFAAAAAAGFDDDGVAYVFGDFSALLVVMGQDV